MSNESPNIYKKTHRYIKIRQGEEFDNLLGAFEEEGTYITYTQKGSDPF